jgi:site-specific DNA-adenine methylase
MHCSLNKSNKKTRGQFYTTNYQYILQNMSIPDDIDCIIEPFAGTGELLNFLKKEKDDKYLVECYDIEPKQEGVVKQDTLLHSPSYENKFVLTNPPYLARNKCKDKTYFDL